MLNKTIDINRSNGVRAFSNAFSSVLTIQCWFFTLKSQSCYQYLESHF